jgi:hypothetical protein
MRVVLINYEQTLLTDNFSDPHVIFDIGLFNYWC